MIIRINNIIITDSGIVVRWSYSAVACAPHRDSSHGLKLFLRHWTCYTLLHSGTLCYTLVHPGGTNWCTLLHSGVLCYTPLHSATLCYTLVHSVALVHWHVAAGTLCYTLVHWYTGILLLVHSGALVHWYVAAGTLWSTLVHTGVLLLAGTNWCTLAFWTLDLELDFCIGKLLRLRCPIPFTLFTSNSGYWYIIWHQQL